jgi:hypothetical protein
MSVRALPYRVPRDRIEASDWISADDGSLIPPALPAWDYGTSLRLLRRVHVDVAGMQVDCGFPDSARLSVCVRYSSSGSRLRQTAARCDVGSAESGYVEVVVEATIPGTDLSGLLTVETTVELATSLADVRPFVASRAGSILWRERTKVRLEGSAGLLPVAPVSFAVQGIPQGAWYISLDAGEWQRAAMGSLLVLLNIDNPQVERALSGSVDKAHDAILWETLGVDIVADLVGRALDDDGFPTDEESSETEDPDVTMAGLVHTLVRSFLRNPTESVPEAMTRLRAERHRDPSLYRANVQRGLRFPRAVGL